MDAAWKDGTWGQFGGAIDMLENAVRECPDEVWGDRIGESEFWYLAYHTLFWLDYYLSDGAAAFTPPPPYTLGELDPAGVLPDRVYTKEELLAYLAHGREKCRRKIAGLTDAAAWAPLPSGAVVGTPYELLLYNLRHVQHHAAQLNLLLRQRADFAPRWVRAAKIPLR
jgi:hypothetical protein